MSSPKLSVIIPTFGREEVLVDTLKQLKNQGFEDYEVLIVDQSTEHKPETKAFLSEIIKDDRFNYFSVSPPSLPAARNFGLSRAKSDIVLYIDDDVVLGRGFLEEHYLTYQHRPEVTAVGGRIEQEGHPQAKKLRYFDEWVVHHEFFNYKHAGEADSFPGGNMSMRAAAASAIGGFDTNFTGTALGEESDLAFRLRKAGHKIYFNPKASLVHLAAPYAGSRISVDQVASLDFYANNLYFVLRNAEKRRIIGALSKRVRVNVVKSKRPWLVAKRMFLFCLGLLIAVRKIIFPIRIEAHENRN